MRLSQREAEYYNVTNSCIESLHPNAVAHLSEIDRTQLSPSSPEGSRNPIRPMPAEHLDNPFFLDRRGAPWARASNNVKKPQNQMCESFRKLDLRFLQN